MLGSNKLGVPSRLNELGRAFTDEPTIGPVALPALKSSPYGIHGCWLTSVTVQGPGEIKAIHGAPEPLTSVAGCGSRSLAPAGDRDAADPAAGDRALVASVGVLLLFHPRPRDVVSGCGGQPFQPPAQCLVALLACAFPLRFSKTQALLDQLLGVEISRGAIAAIRQGWAVEPGCERRQRAPWAKAVRTASKSRGWRMASGPFWRSRGWSPPTMPPSVPCANR